MPQRVQPAHTCNDCVAHCKQQTRLCWACTHLVARRFLTPSTPVLLPLTSSKGSLAPSFHKHTNKLLRCADFRFRGARTQTHKKGKTFGPTPLLPPGPHGHALCAPCGLVKGARKKFGLGIRDETRTIQT